MIDFDYNPPQGPLIYICQDAAVLVMDKPSGLLSVPGKTIGRADCLQTRLRAAHPESLLVHRLDCDTSGLIIFARSKAAQGFLGQEFEQRRAQKTYIARVAGVLAEDHGHIDLPLAADWPNRPRQQVDHEKGRPAQTDWQVIARTDTETRVRLTPHTGRSHQLRVHMLALGHPILGDPIYSQTPKDHPRLMLHAQSLSLHHPVTKARITCHAPCPF
jgi:tRNA pseudouridine32 synthase/23S rRNA pseudouridine746 synthase